MNEGSVRELPTLDTCFFLMYFAAPKNKKELDIQKKMKKDIFEWLKYKTCVVPTVVIAEFYYVTSAQDGEPYAQHRCGLIFNLPNIRLVPLTGKIAQRAGTLRHKCKDYRGKYIPLADCIIAATAIEIRQKKVVTIDPHFNNFPKLETSWY